MTPRASAKRNWLRLWPKLLLPRMLKRRVPTSLFARSLLIIVLPIGVMQIAVTWAFFDAHWRTVTSRLSDGLAGDVAPHQGQMGHAVELRLVGDAGEVAELGGDAGLGDPLHEALRLAPVADQVGER